MVTRPGYEQRGRAPASSVCTQEQRSGDFETKATKSTEIDRRAHFRTCANSKFTPPFRAREEGVKVGTRTRRDTRAATSLVARCSQAPIECIDRSSYPRKSTGCKDCCTGTTDHLGRQSSRILLILLLLCCTAAHSSSLTSTSTALYGAGSSLSSSDCDTQLVWASTATRNALRRSWICWAGRPGARPPRNQQHRRQPPMEHQQQQELLSKGQAGVAITTVRQRESVCVRWSSRSSSAS